MDPTHSYLHWFPLALKARKYATSVGCYPLPTDFECCWRRGRSRCSLWEKEGSASLCERARESRWLKDDEIIPPKQVLVTTIAPASILSVPCGHDLCATRYCPIRYPKYYYSCARERTHGQDWHDAAWTTLWWHDLTKLFLKSNKLWRVPVYFGHFLNGGERAVSTASDDTSVVTRVWSLLGACYRLLILYILGISDTHKTHIW